MKHTNYRKKSVRLWVLILCFVFILPCFVACKDNDKLNQLMPQSDEEMILERIQTFLTAYNQGDMETVLDCLDAKSRNAMEAMLNLISGVAGKFTGVTIDLKDLFSLGVAMTEDDFMKLQIGEITVIDSENAVVVTTMDLTGGGVSTIYFEMKYENDGWYISDMTDKEPSGSDSNGADNSGTSSGNTSTTSDIKISSYFEPDNGIAKIKYKKDGKEYIGFINRSGEIFYSLQDTSAQYFSIGNDVIILSHKNGYTLVKFDGQVVANYEIDKFDELFGYGNGVILMYKDNSNISTVQHTYTMIEGATGNVLKNVILEEEIPKSWWYDDEYYIYMGEGIFRCSDQFYNINTDQRFNYSFDSLDETFVNGKVQGVNWRTYYELLTDGTLTEISKTEYYQNRTELNTDGEYLKITKGGITSEYKQFKLSMLEDDFFVYDNYILIKIKGADGKNYYTVIDAQGNQLFEPKVYSSVRFSEGRVISGMELFDLQGNKIVLESYKYVLTDFSGGIAKAQTDNGGIGFIDINGKPIAIHFASK